MLGRLAEEFIFDALALKERIKKHRISDEPRWSISKAIKIRLIYVYAMLGAIVLTMSCVVSNLFLRRKRLCYVKSKRNKEM